MLKVRARTRSVDASSFAKKLIDEITVQFTCYSKFTYVPTYSSFIFQYNQETLYENGN